MSSDAAADLSERQEWTRQLGDHNRLVWHCRLKNGSDYSPGYVLRFNWQLEGEPEAEHTDDLKCNLISECNSSVEVWYELLEPHDIDPVQFPLPPPHADKADTAKELKQVAVTIATQDFPSKYAYFITNATKLLQGGASMRPACFAVQRDTILEQSVEYINGIDEAIIRSVRLQVNVEDKVSSNNQHPLSGLHGEWLTLLVEKFVDPEVGLFLCTQCSVPRYFINPQSEHALGVDHLKYFYAVGRIIGRACLEGAVLDFHLSAPLVKMMLGIPIDFADLKDIDAEVCRNLTWLLENDDIWTLDLDFTVTQRHKNNVSTVELIPAGRNIQVNDDNKFEFVDCKFRYMMFDSVASQLASFLKGFYEVVPQRLLLAFNYQELDYLLCGADKLDIADWKRHTRLALKSRREVAWFWDVVEHMSDMYQKWLLQFATGCSRAPPIGFQGLTSYDGQLSPFTLVDAGDGNYFRSHPCYNMIELPKFMNKDELHDALYAALDHEYRANNANGNDTISVLL